MDIKETLERFDALIKENGTSAAEAFIKEAAERAEAEGDYRAASVALNELEGIYRVSGRAAEAFDAMERALALLEKAGETETPDYATALLNYATALCAFGRLGESLDVFRRVEALYAKLPEIDEYRAASLWNNMAQALLRGGKFAEAEAYFKKSLASVAKLDGADVQFATCCVNLAHCMTAQKRFDEGRRYLEEAERRFRASGEDSPHSDAAVSCRGVLEYRCGNFAAAAEAFAEAAANCERRFGRSANYARECRNCARAYELAGMAEDAAKWRALAESAARP